MRVNNAGPLCPCLLFTVLALLRHAASQQPCHPDCTKRGNCNAELGQCECQWGIRGPACDEILFPACQLSPDARPRHGKFWPKNCECFRQLWQHFNCTQAGNSHGCELTLYQFGRGHVNCYSYDDLPADKQTSVMPANGSAGVTWHVWSSSTQDFTPAPQETNLGWNVWNTAVITHPLTDCPLNCSTDRGYCIQLLDKRMGPHCQCYKGFEGAGCELTQKSKYLCPNQCNDRGQCLGGFCKCEPPWWGADCSRSKAYPPTPGTVPSRTRIVMYIYDLPAWVSTPLEMDDNLPDEGENYQAYAAFQSLAMSDWAVRTEDPWQANFFLMPAHVYSYSSNTGYPGPHLKRVISYVRETWPFFNRSHGKDHAIWVPGDKGACYAGPDAESLIKISHWGYHINIRNRNETSFLKPTPWVADYACFHPLRDIVAPPMSGKGWNKANRLYHQIQAAKGFDPTRKHLFFFAGTVRPHDLHYSNGVRQAVYALVNRLRNTTTPNGTAADDIAYVSGHTEKYDELHRTSRFCLAPHGSGYGMRLSIAMAFGCIPVIIQDLVVQPLEDVLPYEEFSLRLSKSDIPHLADILRGVTEEEQARLRLGMAKWYQAFSWNTEHGGQAYNWTLRAIHRRLRAHWGNLYH